MHISEIRIDGFTSYLEPTSVSQLSRGINVVVGRNGAGKSNFFAAVRFVLADLTDRSHNDLLYTGRGKRASHSRVEIVLADAGSRFLSLGDDVAIGREIINGTDRYLVNGKPVTKAEARALLDAAGLSYGGNAFFIVPQGDVTRLASASDKARLSTLLAASGAQTFEDRKQLAKQSLKESMNQLDECSKLLTSMEDHLAQVDNDARNLRHHLDLRKKLRGIEHIIMNVERRRTLLVIAGEDAKLDEQRARLDHARAGLRTWEVQTDDDRENAANAESRLAEAEAELELAEREVAARRRDHKAHLSNEFYGDESLLATHASFSETYVDNDSDSDSGMEDATTPEEDLQALRADLAQSSKDLATDTARMRALQLKQGRAARLDEAEREHYRAEAASRVAASISQLRGSLEEERSRRRELETGVESAKQQLAELEGQARASAEEVAALTGEQQAAQAKLSDAESQRAMALLALRKVEISRERLEKAAELQAKQLLASNRAPVVRSIGAIRDLATQLKLGPSQYFGTVAELLTVQPAVAHAVDRVGGQQMFYHVVDSAETVEKLVAAMQVSTVSGSATFVPLKDVIVPPAEEIPEIEGTTALSTMISVADARFEKLVRLFFGKYVLCSDITTAAQYATQQGLPAVTVEGDFCDPRGAISGGSTTTIAKPRQVTIRELCRLKDEIIQQQAESVSQRAAAEVAAQRITQCVDELNKTKVQLLKSSLARQDTSAPVMDAREQFAALSRQLDDSIRSANEVETLLSAAEQERRAAAELYSFTGELSPEEREDLTALVARVEQLQLQCDELSAKEYSLSARIQHRQNRAERRRAAALRREAELAVTEDSGLAVSAAEAEKLFVDAQAEVVRRRRAVDDAEQLVQQARDRLHANEESQRSAESEARALSRRVENHSVKSRALASLVQDIEDKLARLGSIPEEALERAAPYKGDVTEGETDDSSLRRVLKELGDEQKKLKNELNELGDVNVRSINDFEVLSAELENLRRQYRTLESERATIEDTIATLEAQKQEKLDKLLAKVGRKFENVFASLSGNQRGSLILNRNADSGDLESIGLNVPFGKSTAQMSGGQKSLCALALIFAVQACDPASFYIFDEIDANLDETARKRVASTVRAMSDRGSAQFICTTFRKELVQAGDAWFGVTFEGRESHIESIDKQLALEFVSEDQV